MIYPRDVPYMIYVSCVGVNTAAGEDEIKGKGKKKRVLMKDKF